MIPQPCLESHVFPNPVGTDDYMVMLVYKNGSLTREDIRDRYAEKLWEVLNKYLQQTPPLNGPSMRALIEGKLPSMRAHAARVGMVLPPKHLIATGGASANESILNAMASIFGCDIHTVPRPDSASLGAALRAAHGWTCHKRGNFVPARFLDEDKLEKTSLSSRLSVNAGDSALSSKYVILMRKRLESKDLLVKQFGRV